MAADCRFFFFNDTATTEIYTLSLHDALPISPASHASCSAGSSHAPVARIDTPRGPVRRITPRITSSQEWKTVRSEEHTSELQSRQYLVCRLLLEKKKQHTNLNTHLPQPPRAI